MTEIFIVAPTPLMRAGLRALLDAPDFQVVGEGASLRPGLFGPTRAGVVVALAVELSGQLLAELDQAEGPPAIVALSDEARLLNLLQGWKRGGWGLLPSDASRAELEATVRAVAEGLVVLPRPLLQTWPGPNSGDRARLAPLEEPLTGREREVLELLSQGQSNKMIARQLQISEHTVKFHVSSLYTKLDAASRAEAVSRGARLGLITF